MAFVAIELVVILEDGAREEIEVVAMAGQDIAAFAAVDAANFMQALKALIENPLKLLLAR